MPIDNLYISGLAHELNEELSGARIDKIYMPRRDQVVLNLRAENGAKKLVISIGTYAAVWLTDEKYDNPDTPPMFCMMLRKLLANGRVISVTQPDNERIICIKISSTNEMGDITEKSLICELMGRQKNIIIVNEKGIIAACLRNVGLENGNRGIMPGLLYSTPVKSNRPFWLDLSKQDFEKLCNVVVSDSEPEKALCSMVSGMTLSIARQGLGSDSPAEWFASISYDSIRPYIVYDGSNMIDISALKPISCCKEFDSFSKALDIFMVKKLSRITSML